jgi:DNA-binding CsgD family transcriptional regulator
MAEAAARSGRPDQAAAWAEAMRKAEIGGLSPRFAAAGHAAAALAETGDKAWTMFERALAVPGSDRWAFDRARIQLLYGERLRRDQAPARAREQLTAALRTFGQLGAQPWATRAESELRAAGLPGPHSGRASGSTAGPQALTARELEIALLAAAGLPNKQIAERLFLSPRTVSDHLYKVFPKLGITSRAALRDALRENAAPGQERPERSLTRAGPAGSSWTAGSYHAKTRTWPLARRLALIGLLYRSAAYGQPRAAARRFGGATTEGVQVALERPELCDLPETDSA